MIAPPLALVAETLAIAGGLELALGIAALSRFVRRRRAAPSCLPPITILKPLAGLEPRLEEALTSFCGQQYPDFQIVFGVQDPADPAIAVVDRLRQRFPNCPIDLVINHRRLGPNRKIGNLLNMLPAARHDLLVISDSDIHAPVDLLRGIAATLSDPGVGLATCLYSGLPASQTLAAKLGATQISQIFLPGALLARCLGRQDSLGAVMALRRDELGKIGGLESLLPHLADDAVLGRKIAALGKRVELAPSVVATTVPEASLGQLWDHELRWARTIRSLAPGAFAASILQYPLFFALMAVIASRAAAWSIGLFAALWLFRFAAGVALDRRLGLNSLHNFALLPLRDFLSTALVLAAYSGDKVNWRGQQLSTVPSRMTAEVPLYPEGSPR